MDLSSGNFSRRTPSGGRLKEVEIIELSRFGEQIARAHPEWFPAGFKKISAVDTPDFFAWYDGEGRYYLSTSDRQMPGFAPALQLKMALEKHAVKILWHEMQHGRQPKLSHLNPVDSTLLEAITQFVARHTYHELLATMGRASVHQVAIIENGHAYPEATQNWTWLLDQLGVDRLMAVIEVGALLTRTTTASLRDDLAMWLAARSGKEKKSLKRLFQSLGFPDIRDFAAKAAYVRE